MECGRCRAGLIHISIEFRQNCVHKCIQDILGTLRNRTVLWYAITSSNFGIKVSNTSECLKKRNYSITVLLFDDNSSMSIWTSSNAILHNTIWLSTNYFQHQILVSCIYICTSKDLHHQSKKKQLCGKQDIIITPNITRPWSSQFGCNKHHKINTSNLFRNRRADIRGFKKTYNSLSFQQTVTARGGNGP